jgi:hypothetical protein
MTNSPFLSEQMLFLEILSIDEADAEPAPGFHR